MNIIETQGLTRRFGLAEAVARLDVAVPQGSVCALLGPNGAGKSTTLKLLLNLLQPTAGSARVLGVDSRKLGPKELARIGYVAESQKLPTWMTVRQWADYLPAVYPQWDAALEQTLWVQFALPPERKLEHLSRGMLMKAALLTALSYRPELLVLDEPFSGLDPLVRDEFVRGILEVSALGNWTVVVSSHDIEEVERLADRVAVLDRREVEGERNHGGPAGAVWRVEVGAPESAEPGAGWIEVGTGGRADAVCGDELRGRGDGGRVAAALWRGEGGDAGDDVAGKSFCVLRGRVGQRELNDGKINCHEPDVEDCRRRICSGTGGRWRFWRWCFRRRSASGCGN